MDFLLKPLKITSNWLNFIGFGVEWSVDDDATLGHQWRKNLDLPSLAFSSHKGEVRMTK
mgnify:CR=1 FL=1